MNIRRKRISEWCNKNSIIMLETDIDVVLLKKEGELIKVSAFWMPQIEQWAVLTEKNPSVDEMIKCKHEDILGLFSTIFGV